MYFASTRKTDGVHIHLVRAKVGENKAWHVSSHQCFGPVAKGFSPIQRQQTYHLVGGWAVLWCCSGGVILSSGCSEGSDAGQVVYADKLGV